MTRDDDTLPVNPTLAPHAPPHAPETRAAGEPAAQGPLPGDLPDAPQVPAPSTDGLNAQEVATLIGGGDASRAEANEALASAEGLDDPSES